MKYTTEEKLAQALGCVLSGVILLLWLAGVATIGYVVHHFIMKFW